MQTIHLYDPQAKVYLCLCGRRRQGTEMDAWAVYRAWRTSKTICLSSVCGHCLTQLYKRLAPPGGSA